MKKADHSRIRIERGDITRWRGEAIVNAANTTLLGGGGVDGAIHHAAGPGLLEECRALGGCATGGAKITHGHLLLARWVIHTVGPVWGGGAVDARERREDRLLAQCYRSCFALVESHRITSVAFPSISTGAYRFPVERASRIAVREIRAALQRLDFLELAAVLCFDSRTEDAYREALEAGPDR